MNETGFRFGERSLLFDYNECLKRVSNSPCFSKTMQILVNGENRTVAEGSTIESLLLELDLPPGRVAVELNRRIVSRNEWSATELPDGASLEIVHFVGGG
jgi:sulfur carrier protein